MNKTDKISDPLNSYVFLGFDFPIAVSDFDKETFGITVLEFTIKFTAENYDWISANIS